ncbi:hypothetical protein [Actinomyces polynesiensis]|uniref:hypothetical protein n=1 Tax=Actinomyces polynesiensis TaxID=1325934 RepID=UPI0005BA2942|nr:hypothetical protein [Actinomyces polynesiensis]
MATDPRDALNRLIAALENHFDAARSGGADSPALDPAEDRLRDAFFTYDDVLFTTLGVELPFDIVEDEDLEDEDFDEDDIADDEDDDDDDDDDIADIEAD